MKSKFEGETKNIKVASISQKIIKNGGVLTKVEDENGIKYSFFNTKKDGSATAAYEAFQGIRVNDTAEIGYVEEEKEFVGDNGVVKYTQRTIRFAEKINSDGNHAMNPNGTYAPGEAPSLADSEVPF